MQNCFSGISGTSFYGGRERELVTAYTFWYLYFMQAASDEFDKTGELEHVISALKATSSFRYKYLGRIIEKNKDPKARMVLYTDAFPFFAHAAMVRIQD
jgi:hypothetical protein